MTKLHILDLDDTLCDTTRSLQGDPGRLARLRLYDDALKYLEQSDVRKVLVTAGNHDLQKRKIERLRLGKYFQGIFYCQTPDLKETIFRKAAEIFEVRGPQTMVIGDRVETDIRFGNRLGMVTVRIRRPEGKYYPSDPAPGSPDCPAFTAPSFAQLLHILV